MDTQTEEETIQEEGEFESTLYYLRSEKDVVEDMSFKEAVTKVKTFLRTQLKSPNLNVFLGSGCSLQAIPLMGNTFEELKKDEKWLELGQFDGNSKNIEGYLDWLNTGIRFLEHDSSEVEKGRKESLEKSFNTTKKALLDSIVKNYEDKSEDVQQTIRNYRQFYNAIFSIRSVKDYPPINIFTTNYDLFNEVAMEDLGIQYTNGFTGTVRRVFSPSVFQLRLVDDENRYKDKWSVFRRYVKLYKIHGSIDWKYDKNSGSVIQFNNAENDLADILIYPTINKHLETQQSPYSELFRALTISLQKPSSTLIVIGYGFPDEHINHLISQQLMNEDFTLIVFGDKGEEGAKRFIEKHQNKRNFHFIGGSLDRENDAHYFSNVIDYINGGHNDEE